MSKVFKRVSKLFFIIAGLTFLIFSINSTLNYAGTVIGQIAGYIIGSFFLTIGLLQNLLLKHAKKAGIIIISIVFCFSLAFVITFSCFSYSVISKKDASEATLSAGADINGTIISLGTEVRGKNPSFMLSRRLNSTLIMMKKYPNLNCVVSGGIGPGKEYSEAEVMRDVLISNGIDEKRIFMEGNSHNTYQNIRYSKDVINKNNLDKNNIFISTSDFHLIRANMIAKHFGIKSKGDIVSEIPLNHIFPNLIREYLAIIKTYIFDLH